MVNWYMSGGHADGFASTSLRFFKDLDDPSNFKPGAISIQELELVDARRHLAYYQVEQYTEPLANARWHSTLDTPAGVLAQLRSAMSGSLADPAVLFIQQGGQGHSLVPYAIQEMTDGLWHVWVYDSNYPGKFPNDTSRKLLVDTAQNLWSYDLGWGIWTGDAESHSLGVVQISQYALQPNAPWLGVSPGVEVDDGEAAQLWLIGGGHLLVNDSQERQLGYDDGQFVNEIPGASYNVSAGGLEGELEPVYSIPITGTYTISLEAGGITETKVVSVTQFGPGYAVGVQGIVLMVGKQNETIQASGSLFMPPDGSEVAYTAFDLQEVDLLVTFDEAAESYQFLITNADVAAGGKTALFVDKVEQKLGLQGCESSGGVYDLELQRISEEGIQHFNHVDIEIGANDTHYLTYSNLGGAAVIRIEIDEGSDGTINNTIEVVNQAWQIFMPSLILD